MAPQLALDRPLTPRRCPVCGTYGLSRAIEANPKLRSLQGPLGCPAEIAASQLCQSTRLWETWEQAGLVGARPSTAPIAQGATRALSVGEWLAVFDIQLWDDALWRADRLGRPVRESPTLLTEFIALADAPDQAILAFAKEWGLLDLRAAPYPALTAPIPVGDRVYEVVVGDLPLLPPPSATYQVPLVSLGYRRGSERGEPLSVWRNLARQLRALLLVAARLRDGQPGDEEDWQVLGRLVHGTGVAGATVGAVGGEIEGEDLSNVPTVLVGDPRTVAAQRQLLTVIEASLLELARVRPRVYWGEDDRASFTVAGDGLLGALVLRTLSSVMGVHMPLKCTACGRWYFPSGRRPAASRGHYCQKCREAGEPQQLADAARRRRDRENPGREKLPRGRRAQRGASADHRRQAS